MIEKGTAITKTLFFPLHLVSFALSPVLILFRLVTPTSVTIRGGDDRERHGSKETGCHYTPLSSLSTLFPLPPRFPLVLLCLVTSSSGTSRGGEDGDRVTGYHHSPVPYLFPNMLPRFLLLLRTT